MADRVLPSRGAASSWLHDPDRAVAPSLVFDIVEAYASGQVVDRDAIDYEAAYQWASDNFVSRKFVDQCLAAALPELEV